MICILLVSHSIKITDGLKEMIEEMTSQCSHLTILSLGGTDTGALGSDPIKIISALDSYKDSSRFYLFGDIGSALMSIETAIDLVDEEIRNKCTYLDAPLIEGAFVCAIQCMVNASHEEVVQSVTKLYRA